MFRVATGSFRALESAFIADLLALRQSDPLSEILVLVPTGRVRTRLQQQILGLSKGLLNVHFLTFYRLAEEILADGPVHDDRVVGESFLYREIIRDLLEGTSAIPFHLRNEFLGPGKSITRGLPGALEGTLKDLRDAGTRVTDALNAALEGHLGMEATSAAPILELYARVYEFLQHIQVRSPADFLRRATEHAPQSAFLKRQKAVRLYGFYDMTGVQRDLAFALRHHSDSRVYFPYEKGKPAYAFAEKLLLETVAVGTTEDLEPDAEPLPATTFTNCSGARDEIWFVAKEIQRLLDDGIPASEIAVIARRLDPYFSGLRDIFVNHHIPYVTSRTESAGGHPWLKALRASVRDKGDDVSATWSEHCAWARQFTGSLPAADSLDSLIADSLAQLEILDSIGSPISRKRFIETWDDKLDALEMPQSTLHAGVQVLEVQQARGLRFKGVFLIGLNEKMFPRVIREDPFLSDTARSSLAQALGIRLGRKLDGYEEERFLFELMKQTAARYLYLIWQRSNEEGKAAIPSIYLQELLRTQKAKPVRIARSLPDKLKDRAASTLTPKELSFLLNRSGLAPDSLYRVLDWNVDRFNRLLQAHRATESFRPGILALDGLISGSSTLKTLVARGFSPSGLEDLAACPYKFFAGHVLRIPTPVNSGPCGQIAANALGKLFHRTLELYFMKPDLEAACEQACCEFEESASPTYPLVIKSVKQLIVRYLLSFINAQDEELKGSGFQPAYVEQRIESTLAELGPNLAHVRFRGRVDRIDVRKDSNGWIGRVVDYKSGKARDGSGKVDTALIQGRFLQLPIYMGLVGAFLAAERGSNTSVESSTLRWLRLEDQGKPEPYLSNNFWGTPSAKMFIETIAGLVELAEKGHFHIVPSDGEWGHCSRCDYARVCRKEHMPTRARAQNDPMSIQNDARLNRTAPKP